MKLQHRAVDQAAAAGQQADEAYGQAIPVLGCKSTEHVSQIALYQGTTSVVPQAAEKSYFLAAADLRVAKRSARKMFFRSLFRHALKAIKSRSFSPGGRT